MRLIFIRNGNGVITPILELSTNYRTIISKGYHDSGSWEFRMSRDDQGSRLFFGTTTNNNGYAQTEIDDFENLNWHQIVGVYDNNSDKIFNDTELISQNEQNGLIENTNYSVKIGQNGNNSPKKEA